MNATTRTYRSQVSEIDPGHIRFYIHQDGKRPVQVDGRFGKRACGAKCRNSLGPSCTCACGGHNHGKDLWA